MSRTIGLSGPDITDAEINAVVEVLRSGYLSLGPRLGEFEACFQERFNVRHAIACSSGTAGLHLCWRALQLQPGDEVITTPFSFIASANSILFEGGQPVFVDVDPHTWQLDASRIEAAITPKTRAILAVDIFGSFPDMDAIRDIAARHNLIVLEDSCEAIGATYKGQIAGTIGVAGVFAFFPNKQITTGEGGIVITNDDNLAHIVRALVNQGPRPRRRLAPARPAWFQLPHHGHPGRDRDRADEAARRDPRQAAARGRDVPAAAGG
jgi:perosamine synthetase